MPVVVAGKHVAHRPVLFGSIQKLDACVKKLSEQSYFINVLKQIF